MILLPVADEPVKEMTSTSGDSTRASPTTEPSSLTELTTPGGSDGHAARQRMTAAWISGVWCAGLITVVHPAASAGARDRTRSVTGAFHGTMIAATPAASRVIIEKAPGAGSKVRPTTVRARPA
jgi:hypothetical protein